jgi:hypothetical protein
MRDVELLGHMHSLTYDHKVLRGAMCNSADPVRAPDRNAGTEWLFRIGRSCLGFGEFLKVFADLLAVVDIGEVGLLFC